MQALHPGISLGGRTMQEMHPRLTRGAILRGRYVVEGVLATGEFSSLYLVKDKQDNQKSFALIELRDSGRNEQPRMLAQARSLKRLRHPALPEVHDVCSEGTHDPIYILFDYIKGSDLETLQLEQPEQRFSLPQIVTLLAPIVEAVMYLHNQRPPITHGNIKPATIIVPESGTGTVLVNPGFAQEYDADTSSDDAQQGVSAYSAPEQCSKSGRINQGTDIYALGATLYTLFTGTVPADALARSKHLRESEPDPLVPAHQITPTIPAAIANVIQRAMSISSNERFFTVEQFWEAVWQVANISAAPTTLQTTEPTFTHQINDLPVFTAPGPERAVGQATERSVPELLQAGSVPDGVEEREDPDTTIRLPRLPPGVLVPDSVEERYVEKPPPVAPAGVKEQEDLDVVKPPPRPSGGVRAPISLKNLGALFIVLALLIGLGAGASFLSRARSHAAAHSAIPASRTAPPASTPTSAPVASSYPILAGTYSGTIYDTDVNVSTSMFLTVTQQNQGNFSGYLRLESLVKGSRLFRGTIDTTKILQFTVTDAAGNATLFFEGGMQSATSLSGDYYQCGPAPIRGGKCIKAPGGYGIWNVIRTSSGSSSSLLQSSIAEVADGELYSQLLGRRQDKAK
jgi:eukaryotic-like serine/threonine-protein kinase